MVTTSDAASQLVQLCEPELVGAVHDDRVGNRNVDARFDDGCADEHIELAPVELAHDALKFSLAHLAVGNANARFRNQLSEHLGAGLNGIHVVMKEIHLSAALEFADNGLSNQRLGFAAHESLDREAFLRCRSNHREVADALKAHRQRSGNRSGGERQNVDFRAQAL